MSTLAPASSLSVAPAPAKQSLPVWIAGRLFGVPGMTPAAVMSAAGVALFVDLVILAVEAVGIWSVSRFFHLPATVTVLFATLVVVPAAWACWKVVQLALRSERDMAEGRDPHAAG